jgi:RimJ/RimL family protein N-acetyltransferase
MELKPIDSAELIERVAGWLASSENSQWLDFGDGQKPVTPAWVKIIARSPRHVLRVFTSDDGEPIGVVALGTIDHTFKTATLWFVLGDKRYARAGYTTRAAAEMMRFGFCELSLHAINTWTVDGNPSIKIVTRVNFKPAGRQRQCHWIDGCPRDRLLFDVLASEYLGEIGQHE